MYNERILYNIKIIEYGVFLKRNLANYNNLNIFMHRASFEDGLYTRIYA